MCRLDTLFGDRMQGVHSSNSFTHPIWALLADFKMFELMVAGKMNQELDTVNRDPRGIAF
jgi:hypothetical protein